MDIARSSHHSVAHSRHSSIELESRNSQNSSAARRVDGAQSARQEEISRIAHLLENSFPGGEEIRDSLHQKATVLHDELHQSHDDVKAQIGKAYHLDEITSSIEGAAKALGYALSGVPGDLIGKGLSQALGLQPGTPMHDLVTGMSSGVTAVGLKAILEKVQANSMQDTKWMQADMDALEPFMQEVMKQRDSLTHKYGQAAMGGLGFDARNVFTGALSIGTQALPENDPAHKPAGILAGAKTPGYIANNTVSAVLTAAAGSMSGVVQNKYNRMHGPEFMFGRTDWKERYQALMDTSVSSQLTGGGKQRMITAGKDAFMTTQNWGAGLKNLRAWDQLAEKLALGLGLGATNMLKTAARDGIMSAATSGTSTNPAELLKKASFRALQDGGAQLANLAGGAVAYLGQGVAGVTTNALLGRSQNRTEAVTQSSSESDSASTTTASSDTPSPARVSGEEARVSDDDARASSEEPRISSEETRTSREEARTSVEEPRTSPTPPRAESPVTTEPAAVTDVPTPVTEEPARSTTPAAAKTPSRPSSPAHLETVAAESTPPATPKSGTATPKTGPLKEADQQDSSHLRGSDLRPWWTDSALNQSGAATPTSTHSEPAQMSRQQLEARELAERIGRMGSKEV